MIRADVTSVSPLLVQPKDAVTGQAPSRVWGSTAGLTIGDEVRAEVIDGQLEVYIFAASVPPFARKTGDTARASTTTVADDPHLTVALAASVVYVFRGQVIFDTGASAVPDIKLVFAAMTGASVVWSGVGAATTATSDVATEATNVRRATGADPLSFGGIASSTCAILVEGVAVMGSTAGTLKLQWAQNVSDAQATTVKQNSWLLAKAVA